MRPAFALLVWLVLVGGLAIYTQGGQPSGASIPLQQAPAAGDYSIEVTTSFDAVADPFALRIEGSDEANALLVRVNGKDVLRVADRVSRGTTIRIENARGILAGRNELYVEAAPPPGVSEHGHSALVKVVRDGTSVLERTIRSQDGAKLSAAVAFDAPRRDGSKGADYVR